MPCLIYQSVIISNLINKIKKLVSNFEFRISDLKKLCLKDAASADVAQLAMLVAPILILKPLKDNILICRLKELTARKSEFVPNA